MDLKSRDRQGVLIPRALEASFQKEGAAWSEAAWKESFLGPHVSLCEPLILVLRSCGISLPREEAVKICLCESNRTEKKTNS